MSYNFFNNILRFNIIYLYFHHLFQKIYYIIAFKNLPTKLEKYQTIKEYSSRNNLVIETGTYYGDFSFYFKNYFKKIISIEAQKKYYKIALDRHKFNNKITILLGKSQDILLKILSQNLKDKKILFFLDAHWSWKDTFKEKNHTPIEKEIKIIVSKIKKKKITIIIDDFRCFADDNHNRNDGSNYPNYKKILKIVKKKKFYYMIKNDMLFIFNHRDIEGKRI